MYNLLNMINGLEKQKRPQKTIGNCLDDKLSDY